MSDNPWWSRLVDGTGRPLPKAPNDIRVGVTAVIFNERGDVLLEKRSDNGWWGLPGGAVDVGESVSQAAVREVFEETGLSIEVTRLVGVYSDPWNHAIASYPDGNVTQFVTLCLECTLQAGDLRMSSESTDLRYFPFNDLPEKSMPGHLRRIMDTLERSSEAFIR